MVRVSSSRCPAVSASISCCALESGIPSIRSMVRTRLVEKRRYPAGTMTAADPCTEVRFRSSVR